MKKDFEIEVGFSVTYTLKKRLSRSWGDTGPSPRVGGMEGPREDMSYRSREHVKMLIETFTLRLALTNVCLKVDQRSLS